VKLVGDKGTVLLIHGGLWEDVSADRFWGRTGVIDGLERRGLTVIAPDRLRRAPDWTTEARHIAQVVAGQVDAPAGGAGAPHADGRPLTVVGGSFGCAVAVRMALEFPRLAGRLVLAWPAALADQFTTIRMRSGLSRAGARGATLNALLGTAAVPSATDAEVALLDLPVGIVPALPPGPLHPRSAVDALLRLLPSAVELPGCPEAHRPEFAPQLDGFLDVVAAFAEGSSGA
jgi:pimeloyl-ACP methyl ester carboxylesterase